MSIPSENDDDNNHSQRLTDVRDKRYARGGTPQLDYRAFQILSQLTSCKTFIFMKQNPGTMNRIKNYFQY